MSAIAAGSAAKALSTEERLLSATECLVILKGASGLSIRHIATEAGLNSALVSYYFGGLPRLLADLLTRNVEIIRQARATRLEQVAAKDDQARRLEALLAAYLEPIWLTPAVWHKVPARTVVRELLPIVDAPVRASVVKSINQSVSAVAELLQPLLPRLTQQQLFMRLRLLSGATEMLNPRLDELGLYPIDRRLSKAHQELLASELLQFALGALQA